MRVSGQQHSPAALYPGRDPVPILQEAGWAPGPVWTGGKSRPHRDSILDRPAHSSVAIPTELPGPHTHTHTHTLYMYIYIYVYVCVCIYIYIHTHKHTHTHTRTRARTVINLILNHTAFVLLLDGICYCVCSVCWCAVLMLSLEISVASQSARA